MRRSLDVSRALLVRILAFSALAAIGSAIACSLGNIHPDSCATDAQCAAAFGAASRCGIDGYCTDPADPACAKTGPDGIACYACAPQTGEEILNACGDGCIPFDNRARVPKLSADGGVPPLP